MAHIIMSQHLVEEISKKTDLYLKNLYEGKSTLYNLVTLKDAYLNIVKLDLLKRYSIRDRLASTHAEALITSVIDHRVSLVNC